MAPPNGLLLSKKNRILSRAFLYWLDLIKIKGRVSREFNNTHLWMKSLEEKYLNTLTLNVLKFSESFRFCEKSSSKLEMASEG